MSWKAYNSKGGRIFKHWRVNGIAGNLVCTLPESLEGMKHAQLIAASPLMLAALRSIEAVLNGSQPKDIPGALMVAQHAIAQAEGVKP